MDSSRTPLSPGSNKRRRVSPSGDLPMGSQSQQQQTSLPSIRQLHPYLPPSSSMPQHLSSESSSYAYSTPSHYPSHLGQVDTGPSHAMGTTPQREAGVYGAGDSEADDVDQRGPPKKKRRRQALSCTECKRRKIKCDRTQPCTPCTRRGEESGCQWHIVEPVEKYATKAEFDELKARFEQLTALVQRLLPAAATSLPYYQMGVQPAMPGVAGEAVQSYSSATSGPIGYSSMMPPPPQPPQQQQAYPQHMETSSQATNRYMKSEGAQSPTRHAHQSQSISSASPITSSTLHNPSLSRHRLESSPTSAAASVKSSPLSLASITSPYHPDQSQLQQAQSKNYHAQTLILGERLRPGSEDPMNFFVKTRPLSEQERQRMTPLAPRCLSIAPRLQRGPRLHPLIRFSPVLRDELVIRVRMLYRQETTIGPV